MSDTHETLNFTGACAQKCKCGEWTFREVPVIPALGLSCAVVHCPQCKHNYLIPLRVWITSRLHVRSIGIVQYTRRNKGNLRTALMEFAELNEDEVEYLVTIAGLMAIQFARAAS